MVVKIELMRIKNKKKDAFYYVKEGVYTKGGFYNYLRG